jgi:hypothetical protein
VRRVREQWLLFDLKHCLAKAISDTVSYVVLVTHWTVLEA